MISNFNPVLIISHSHSDYSIAKALINYLLLCYELNHRDIRCTSIPDNALEIGNDIHQSLKAELKNCAGIIAILSYSGLHSTYVKYELASAWIQDKPILPILGPQVNNYEKHLGPIKELQYIKVEDRNVQEVLSFHIRNLLERIGIKSKNLADEHVVLNNFISSYMNYGNIQINFESTDVRIIEPKEGAKVNQKIKVVVEKRIFPENAFLWVAMGNANTDEFWPKEHLPIDVDSCYIQEGGMPAPGELGVWLIGVGLSGHRKFEEWFINGTRHGKGFPPFKVGKVPGMTLLARADKLVIRKK